MQPVNSKTGKTYSILFTVVLLCGLAARVYQHFILGRPLWEDEAHLALNFIDSGYIEMFMPLKHFQSAPILFLLWVETFSNLFGFSEIALRSFPFIIATLSYPLFYFMVRDMTRNSAIAIIAFVLLSFNAYSIQYSSELKPYIVEQAVYIVLGFLSFSRSSYVSERREKLLAWAGCISLFIANTSFVVLVAIVLYRLWNTCHLKATPELRTAAKAKNKKLFITWSIAFTASIILNIIINPYADNMRELWKPYFIPLNIFSSQFIHFTNNSLHEIFFGSVFYFPSSGLFSWLPIVLFLSGLFFIIVRKQYALVALCLLPLAVHCFLSWIQLYPIYTRFVLYLAPALIILFATGIVAISSLLSKFTHKIAGVVIAIVMLYGSLAPSFKDFPKSHLDIRPAIAYVNEQPHDMKLYTTTTKNLYEYYLHTGLAKNATRSELKWYISPSQYMDSVQRQSTDYMLIHARNNIDGYQPIVDTLNTLHLIKDSFIYSEYRVLIIKPAVATQMQTVQGF